MIVKEENKIFNRIRVSVRWFGVLCGVTPVLSYLIFAASLDKITTVYDDDFLTSTVIKDNWYMLAKYSLTIGNESWTYLLPISLAIAAVDIGIGVYRQFASS